MTTAASPLLGLALPVTGELSGTWGDTVNNAITSLLDSAVAGTTTISVDADKTLSTTTLAANEAREAVLLCSGARTAIRTVTAPAQSKAYVVINNTTGGFAVKLVGAGPTTGVSIANGRSAFVAWNGSDFVTIASNDASTLSGLLAVANGGTGLSSGTSGGVLYYSASGVLASSAALVANAVVIGGGAGSAPSTTTTGTGVITAIGNNANATGGLTTTDGTATLTNKRIDPRVSSTSSASSVTPTIASFDIYAFTALAATLTINAPTGTPVDGDKLIFRILDNGTPQTLSWNATYTVIGTTLPTTTTASKMTYVGCIYNAANTRWDVVAVTTQA